MLSGSSSVSQSISARVSSAALKPHQASPVGLNPQRAVQKANPAAVASSTSG
jgi:hypothetical protein